MNNKTIGNSFEIEYAGILSKNGFWVAYMTPKKNIGSQPCDLIAIKNDISFLVDCKTCKTHLFSLNRVEENQRQAFKKYIKCGNTKYILAIKYNGKIYEIDMKDIDFRKKYIDLDNLEVDNENYSIEEYKNTKS